MRKLLSVIFILLLTGVQGCGRKPAPVIPADISADKILNVIEKRMKVVRDFSGRAHVKANIRGEVQSGIVYIKYMRPGRFRAILKGTFGIILAVITAEPDSMTVYVPSMNGYFIIGHDDKDAMDFIIPEVTFDFSYITTLFTGIPPPTAGHPESRMSFKHNQNQAILTIENEGAVYRYAVEGSDMQLVEEELSRDGEIILRMVYSDYAPCGNTVFPRKITVTGGEKKLQMEFSSCTVNDGLAESDLTFKLPPNADRLIIKKTGFP